MLAKTHKAAELLTQAMGPVFQKYPDYNTVMQAVGIAIARVAQCTPMKGTETKALNNICAYAETALEEFLTLEETKGKLESGVADFAQFRQAKEGEDEEAIDQEKDNAEAEETIRADQEEKIINFAEAKENLAKEEQDAKKP